MKELFDELWVSIEELICVGVNRRTVETGVLRQSPLWYSIKDPIDRRKNLIRYSTLSDGWKRAIKLNFCGGLEPVEWLELQKYQKQEDKRLESRFSLVGKLEQMCEHDYIQQGIHYRNVEPRQFRSICRAAGVVDVTADWYTRNRIPFSDHGPAKMVSEWVKQHLNDYFPLKYVPVYHRLLLEKARDYANGVPMADLIQIPRLGNNNSASHKEEKWWKEIAIHYRIHDKAYTQAQIYRKLTLISERGNLENPSESVVRQFFKSKEHLTVESHSDLNNKRLQRHRPTMPMGRAMFSDDCWEMDGTRVQFMGHLTGKRATSGKAEVKQLYLVTVRDVYSGAYIGYWYGYSESEHAYRSALKMAVEVTGRLPYELRYDQFPGSTSATWKTLSGTKDEHGLLQHFGVKLTKTSKSTGKAHAERGFYTLQQVFESETEVYIGQGIKSSLSHARPTEKYIARTQREFLNNGWNFDQAVLKHMEVIASYNATPLSHYSRKYADLDTAPMDMYLSGLDDSGVNVTPLQIADLFWHTRKVGIRNGKIEFKDRTDTHKYYIGVDQFELFDYQRENVQVIVRHDPFDLSEIMVFCPKDRYLATLHEESDIQTYGRNADWEAAGKWKQEQAKITNRKRQELSEFALSEESAALLPTTVAKADYNDAQSAYAMNHIGEWQDTKEKVAKRSKKGKIEPVSELFTIEDISNFVRNQL